MHKVTVKLKGFATLETYFTSTQEAIDSYSLFVELFACVTLETVGNDSGNPVTDDVHVVDKKH